MDGSPTVVTVPDLSSADLVSHAARVLRDVNIDWEMELWDFLPNDERGASFDVRTHSFGHRVFTADVCQHFLKDGYDGNAAAFISFIMTVRPKGWFASLTPHLAKLWRHRTDSTFKAPCYMGGDIFLANVNDHWSAAWTFVAFRRV